MQETIKTLVAKNVAITSTLPVFEAGGAPLAQSGICFVKRWILSARLSKPVVSPESKPIDAPAQ